MEIPELDQLDNILVIGDTHFQPRAFEEGEELIEKCLEAAEELSPAIIILLGDILDTHETAKNSPWKQACKFIEGLSAISPVYIIMGNHDLINQSQFLTDNHFFIPFKKWGNVTVVDTSPIRVEVGDSNIVLCPYVPPGRFEAALDQMVERGGCEEDYDWKTANCIFGHQEIAGVEYNGIESTKGDLWDEAYPPLICGHIHTPCQIGTNVYYPGSARQVASNEAPDKRIWIVKFDDEGQMQYTKIDLGLKGKKEIELAYEDLDSFDFDLTDKYHIKLKLHGTPEQFKMFRKSQMHAKMVRYNIKIGFVPIKDEKGLFLDLGNREEVSFTNILRTLVKGKKDNVKSAYEKLMNDELSEENVDVENDEDDEDDDEEN